MLTADKPSAMSSLALPWMDFWQKCTTDPWALVWQSRLTPKMGGWVTPGVVTIFMTFICISSQAQDIWVSNEVKWRSRATWRWYWFQLPNQCREISRHKSFPECLTGASSGFANTRPWNHITTPCECGCVWWGGSRASLQSRIYPRWSESIISQQCNSTLITTCHKYTRAKSRALWRSTFISAGFASHLSVDRWRDSSLMLV